MLVLETDKKLKLSFWILGKRIILLRKLKGSKKFMHSKNLRLVRPIKLLSIPKTLLPLWPLKSNVLYLLGHAKDLQHHSKSIFYILQRLNKKPWLYLHF